MKILYLDLFSGIAGDMTLSALVDLGADPALIMEQAKLLGIGEFRLQFNPVIKQGVSGLHLTLLEPHPHLHHASFKTIQALIEGAGLSSKVSDHALAIFKLIAIAEGKIHNQAIEKVHFHEVGAADSLLDILGVCLALEQLQPDLILASPVELGHGSLTCQHGVYPVPAPAALEILKGVPVRGGSQAHELTTPTGAAIIKHFVTEFSAGMPAMKVEKIGYGAGTLDLNDRPNILRAIWGEALD